VPDAALRSGPLIFDCDGTLVASEPLYAAVDAEILGAFGIPLSADEIRSQYMGVGIARMLADMARRFGATFPDDIIETLDAAVMVKLATELQAIAGVASALASLHRQGHPMAVATNSRLKRTRENLRTTKLDHFFGDLIASLDQVAEGKPAPDVYLLAAQKLGVRPGDCIAIEDSPVGMQAVIAAGMTGVGFAPSDHGPGIADELRAAGAHLIVENMRDLPGAIRSATALCLPA
jgi:HAD superfamily hydrolase (TIGR01509 family)